MTPMYLYLKATVTYTSDRRFDYNSPRPFGHTIGLLRRLLMRGHEGEPEKTISLSSEEALQPIQR